MIHGPSLGIGAAIASIVIIGIFFGINGTGKTTSIAKITSFLKNAGFSVIEAENGEVGLAAAKINAVDLMIVDVNMPVMDGITMITQVRQLAGHTKTPIFVLTTQASRVTSAKGKANRLRGKR